MILAILATIATIASLTTMPETPTGQSFCAGHIKSHILLQLYNSPNQTYTQYSYVYQATANTATLMFCFLNRPNFWALDDVSMTASGNTTELLGNGGFEIDNWDAWTPYNSFYIASGISWGYLGFWALDGSYFYLDVQNTTGDGIFQNVTTVAGQNYTISFYLANPYGGNVSVAIASIGP